MEDTNINIITSNKRIRDDSEESDSDSPEAKRIRENLLDDIIDEFEFSVERNPANLDLVSVMKSFEEEISNPPSHAEEDNLNLVTGDEIRQPELGYLLEASDDELGLPPTFSSSSSEEDSRDLLLRVPSDTVGLDQIWGFEDEIPSYEFGIGEEKQNINHNNNDGGDFVGLEGLFEYSDVLSGLSDFSDFSWRTELSPGVVNL
ncbi:hypothetical protein BVC80_1211g67 [Macleaya cordata]|uniref:Uncharacterized protein n=1 Tax=Macleaya cordata TaxID=56857 RepID=A0A200Q3G5_MACCD|nr:hypothetical protein BVC80_1211g67 [Macleaya cordata]